MLKSSLMLFITITAIASGMEQKKAEMAAAASQNLQPQKTIVKLLPRVCFARKNFNSTCKARFPTMGSLNRHRREVHALPPIKPKNQDCPCS